MATTNEYGQKLFVVRVTTPVSISEQGVVLHLDITDYEFGSREDAMGCIEALHDKPVGNFKKSGSSILDLPKTTAIPLNFKHNPDLKPLFYLDVGDLSPEQIETCCQHITLALGIKGGSDIKLSQLAKHIS